MLKWTVSVIELPSGLFFGSSGSYASIAVRNCGTTDHTFRFKMVRSDDWEAEGEALPPVQRRLPRVDALNAPDFTNVVENAEWTATIGAGEVRYTWINGKKETVSYWTDGEPALCADGYHEARYTYNAAGKLLSARYFDTEGSPTETRSGVVVEFPTLLMMDSSPTFATGEESNPLAKQWSSSPHFPNQRWR